MNESIILETRQGTHHTHVNECGQFTVTKLIKDVIYTLEQNKYYTAWIVRGTDEKGDRHVFTISRSAMNSKESRFCGNFS